MAQLNEKIVNRISFNNNYDCFACITNNHLRIFNSSPLREISEIDCSMFGNIFMCEMLDRTNLLALVTEKESNVFQLYDDCKKKIKMRITFNQNICGIRFQRRIIAIILRSETYIYILNYQNGLSTKPVLLYKYQTCDNPMGLCDITRSSSSLSQIIVSPHTDKGAVKAMRVKNYNSIVIDKHFKAHETGLSSIVLNYNGSLLATASEKGTIIRIWNFMNKANIQKFRRGINSASIYCMNFSRDSQYICCSSDKGTVHIFSINGNASNLSAKRSTASFSTNSECAVICAFIKSDIVIALGLNGTFRRYSVESNGCKLREYDEFLQLCANPENT